MRWGDLSGSFLRRLEVVYFSEPPFFCGLKLSCFSFFFALLIHIGMDTFAAPCKSFKICLSVRYRDVRASGSDPVSRNGVPTEQID